MKLSYIVVSLIAILGWNVFLIQRDSNLFKAYNACAHYTNHPDCPYDQK
jgi:hypothetical protein